MTEIRQFRRDDLLRIRTHPRYAEVARTAYMALAKADEGFYRIAYTAVRRVPLSKAHIRLEPIACCGIHRGLAWAFLSPKMTPAEALRVSFKVRQVLEVHSAVKGPVLARIDPDFALALRWAKLLGFARVEGTDKWVYDDQL